MKLLRLCLLPALPLVALLATLAACGTPFSDTPPMADSTFISTLAGLHLAEAHLRRQQDEDTYRSRSDTLRVPLPPAVRDSVLARHGVSYRSFRTTLDYYVRHPDQYASLYARVVDTLDVERKVLRLQKSRSLGASSGGGEGATSGSNAPD